MGIRSLFFGLLFTLLFLTSNKIYSQRSNWIFGAYTGIKIQSLPSDFNSIPQISRPLINYDLESSLPFNPELGISTFYSLDWIKFGLSGIGGFFNTYRSNVNEFSITSIDGLPVKTTINHKVDLNNFYFSILPEIKINPFDKLNLHFATRFTLNTTNYNYSQTITEPKGIEFTDIKEPKSGTINLNQLNFEFGLSYLFDLNDSWFLSPKLIVSLPNSSLPFNTNNNTNSIYFRSGIDIEYNKFSKILLYDTVVIRDTTILSSKFKKGIQLDETSTTNEVKEDANTILYSTTINQKFINFQEEEKLILGSITAKFINTDSSENDKINLKIKQKIISNYSSNNKLSKSFKIDDFINKLDTTLVCDLPNVKFYIDYELEDSLNYWQINISNNNQLVKQFRGNEQNSKDILWLVKEQYQILDLIGKEFSFDFKLYDINNNSYELGSGSLLFNYELTSHTNDNFDQYNIAFDSSLLNKQNRVNYLRDMISYFSKIQTISELTLELPQDCILKIEDLSPKNKKGLILKPSPINYFKLKAE
jgi:hypothetical protein